MIITGQILKENRLKKKLSLSEVASATKINTRVLSAMEEGDLDKLPAKSFLKGFIRSYAKYLSLDVEQVMQTYSEEIGEQPKTNSIVNEMNHSTDNGNNQAINDLSSKTLSSKITMAVGIILLISLIIGVKNIVEKYEKEGEAVPESLLDEIESSLSTPTPSDLKPSEQLALGPEQKTAYKNDSTSSVDFEKEKKEKEAQAQLEKEKKEKEAQAQLEKEKKEKEAQAQLEKEKKEKEAQAQLEKEKKEKEAQAQLEKEKQEKLPKKKVPLGLAQEIILEALDNISIEVIVDGGPKQILKIPADNLHVIKAKNSIEFFLKDGGSVSLIYNGKDIGVPGDLGKPLKLKFPRGN